MPIRVIKLPDIGEGVAEAEIVAWHVKIGDVVREDQPLADVMTDKATVEVPSPADGTVLALGGETGEMLAVGAELLRLDVSGSATTPQAGIDVSTDVAAATDAESGRPVSSLQPAADGLEPAVPATGELRPREPARPSPPSTTPPTPPRVTPATGNRAPLPPRAPGARPVASPAVRRRALELGIDLRQVRGGGGAGRIRHEDLDAHLATAGEPEPEPAPAVGRRRRTEVEEVKVVGLRRRIAQRMADSKRRVAHFSYVDEVDVTALEELRAALNVRFGQSRPKLTLLPFLVRALARTLPDFVGLNAWYDDEAEIVRRHAGIHVGIATQTPAGLMVPVLRHAEARDLWEVAGEVRRLADAARAGTAARDELTGSTITITSLGALGGIASTPVINRPEVAIVGVNKQAMRPVWRDGAFVPRLVMNLSSSFDHRVVDGYDAALFIQALKASLEVPATLFLEA